jgi:hypothetical protein
MCLSLLTNSALVIRVQMRGGGGGSCGVSANEYSCAHHVTWSPNKDLLPYLTYVPNVDICSLFYLFFSLWLPHLNSAGARGSAGDATERVAVMALDLQLADSYSSPLLPSQDMSLAIIYSLCTLYIQYICTYSIIKDLSNFVAYLMYIFSRHYTIQSPYF